MKRYLMLFMLIVYVLCRFISNDHTRLTQKRLAKSNLRTLKIGNLTNLMDISRNDDILVNAKQLYQEALKANDNYYKEAALTEILRRYINTDQTDSANIYIAKAEQELKRRSQSQPRVVHENDTRYGASYSTHPVNRERKSS